MWYHWIDKEQLEWAAQETEERHHHAWADFKANEVEEVAAKSKAVRERWVHKHREEQRGGLMTGGRD
jgi:hypothetical protein